VFFQAAGFDFVNYDDDLYVYANPAVKAGLTAESLRWAFTSVIAGHWAPLTLLSHLVVYQLFHLDHGAHHLTNLLLHLLASIALFAALKRATGARWPSAFTAFLFALHPLHVESVAWVSERKDTLAALWWFLALYAYVRYAERPNLRRYLLVILFFCLGLLSKQMLVTFPFALLLFDFWPLERLKWPRALWEKLPLMALSAAACLVAYRTQQTDAVVAALPLTLRIGNALVSYFVYVRETLAPVGLAVFYPYPQEIALWKVAGALAVLAGITAAAVRAWRTRPYLAAGWFWFLGTLVPVIGLVKVGEQARADHFTYIPLVGLALMAAWGAADIVAQWPQTRTPIATVLIVFCCACMVLSWRQAGFWRNCETLYRHAIEVTGDNWLGEGNLGQYLMNLPGRHPEAMQHLEEAVRIRPGYAEAHNNLGLALARIELCSVAIPHFETALRAKPALIQARNNLGMCLTRVGNYGAAISQLEMALQLQPDYANAHFNLALTLTSIGRYDDAIKQYEAGLRAGNRSTADSAEAHRRLGELLANRGRTNEAIAHLEAAQEIQSDSGTSEKLQQLRVARH
jgi:tetratricopeptide (TPR) repeat protein